MKLIVALVFLAGAITVASAFAEDVRTFPGGGAADLLNVTKNPFEEADRKKASTGVTISVACRDAHGREIRAGQAGYEDCAKNSGTMQRIGENSMTVGSGSN